MESCPNLVKEDLAPSRLQSRRAALFNLELNQLILDVIGCLAALEQMGMNIL